GASFRIPASSRTAPAWFTSPTPIAGIPLSTWPSTKAGSFTKSARTEALDNYRAKGKGVVNMGFDSSMTRRTWMQTTAGIGAASLVAPAVFGQAAPEKKVRIGIVGGRF